MKFSKKSILVIGGTVILTGLGSIFVPTIASDSEDTSVQLYVKPDNAVQHFRNVKIIASGDTDDSNAIIYKNGNSVGIDTNNFILSKVPEIGMTRCDVNKDGVFNRNDATTIVLSHRDVNGDGTYDGSDISFCTNINQIINGAKGSSILGGIANTIEAGNTETILGGNGNKIGSSESSSILGGTSNTLTGTSFSTIFGGQENNITGGRSSSIIGGTDNNIDTSYSTTIGNINTVTGYNSIAIGFKSKVTGRNSFLWTDGNSTKTLGANNTFAIIGNNGMVINSKKAHTFAKLTISNSLIVYDDKNAPACAEETEGVLKVITGDNYNSQQICFCSCDGIGRNALHEGTRCQTLCSNDTGLHAECGTAQRDCTTDPYSYTGSCTEGTLVEGTGAFLVSTEKKSDGTLTNYINRSCQAVDGQIKTCKKKLEGDGCENHYKEQRGCTGTIYNAYRAPGSNHNPNVITKKRAYNTRDYDNQDCAYFCNTGFVAFEGACYECEEGTVDPDNPYKCKFTPDCGEGRFWNPNKLMCELNGICKYKKDGSNFNTEKGIQNITAENIEEILPEKDSGENYYLRCIDDGNYKAEYIEHTCAYKCKPGYYCKGGKDEGVCTQPSCKLNLSTSTYGDSYYVTGQAKIDQFNAGPTWVKDGAKETSGRFYDNYANKPGCYYWCPEKNRVYYNGMRRCFNEEKVEELSKINTCANTYVYGNVISYKNPSTSNQAWTYVSPKELSEKKASNAKGCFWSCEEGSIVIYWQALRISTYTPWWPAGYKFINTGSTAKSCYKKCAEGEVLDKNGHCQSCPNGQIPNPNSLQTGQIQRKTTSSDKIQRYPFIQYYDTTGTVPEEMYGILSEYRNCIKDCGEDKVLINNTCVDKYTAGNCTGEDRKLIGSDCIECKQNISMRSGNDCIEKKGKLELNIQDQTKKNSYTSGDKIIYKITIKNTGNLGITGIVSTVNMGNSNTTNNFNGTLGTGKTYSYTGTYTFKTNDFKDLSQNQTGSFTINVTAVGTAVDDYVKNVNVTPRSIQVTIKKT